MHFKTKCAYPFYPICRSILTHPPPLQMLTYLYTITMVPLFLSIQRLKSWMHLLITALQTSKGPSPSLGTPSPCYMPTHLLHFVSRHHLLHLLFALNLLFSSTFRLTILYICSLPSTSLFYTPAYLLHLPPHIIHLLISFTLSLL